MIGIYKIENKINGKVYIGQSVNIQQRWAEHKSDLRNNKHENSYLQYSWNKYGEENFVFKILEECSQEDLDDKEIFWIDSLQSYVGFDNANGYNLTIGGGGTRKIHKVIQFSLDGIFIKEWDNGIIASNNTGIAVGSIYGCIVKRLTRAGDYIWMYSDDYSEENLQWYLNKQKCRIVLQYDKYGNFIKEWESLAQIIEQLHFNPVQCVNHITKSCHGYIFKYKDDPLEITPEYAENVRNILKNLCNKPFYQLDENANIIKRYNSLNDAVRDGWTERMINECCRGLRKNHKGYVWVFEEDHSTITPEICKELLKKEKVKYYSILQYDLDGNFVREYAFLKDVKKDGFTENGVYDCCMNRKIQHKGYIWRFRNEVQNPQNHPVMQYDKQNNFIAEYESIRVASEKTGISETCIGGVCNKRKKSTHGFVFVFKSDSNSIPPIYCKVNTKKVVCLNNKIVFNSLVEASNYACLSSTSSIGRVVLGKAAYAGKSSETGEKLKWMDYNEYIEKFGDNELIPYIE